MPSDPIRVLLADDHAVVRTGIRQFLEHADDILVVDEAADGITAQQLIEQHHPDVVVLDIQMPYASGIDVTRWVRSNYQDIGVLILTAYDDDPYVLAVLQAGANGYVLKTAPPLDIIQAVRDVHAGKTALDQVVTNKILTQVLGTKPSQTMEELTDRELEVLALAGRGYTNKAIGIHLSISDRTVQGHLARVFKKLQASSRTEAVMRAVAMGWLPSNLVNSQD